jgi:hypothetical protein
MRLIFIALKTELTREILLSVRFLFFKEPLITALRPQTGRQKIRLNLLGGVFNERRQRTICRSAHLPTIGRSIKRVKLSFGFFFSKPAQDALQGTALTAALSLSRLGNGSFRVKAWNPH